MSSVAETPVCCRIFGNDGGFWQLRMSEESVASTVDVRASIGGGGGDIAGDDRIEDALVLLGDLGCGEQAARLHLRDAEFNLTHELLVQSGKARAGLAGDEGAVEVGVEARKRAGLVVDSEECAVGAQGIRWN